jgi:hypothetical protein
VSSGCGINQGADQQVARMGGVDGSLRSRTGVLDKQASRDQSLCHPRGRIIEIEAWDQAPADLPCQQSIRLSFTQCKCLVRGAYQPDAARSTRERIGGYCKSPDYINNDSDAACLPCAKEAHARNLYMPHAYRMLLLSVARNSMLLLVFDMCCNSASIASMPR